MQVVLAKHKKTGQYAALKVVHLLNPELDPEHLAIIRREAEFLCMLDHPHIVECLDVVDDGRHQVRRCTRRGTPPVTSPWCYLASALPVRGRCAAKVAMT